jgi:CRISPR system Cascade subunit CasB
MSQFPESVNRFVGYLEKLYETDDRAALAQLRRGIGKEPGTAAEMFKIVVPRLPHGLSPYQEDAYFLIAALFASHPEAGGQGNLGTAFARLKAATDSESIEKRFIALLNSHEDDLATHLRHAVSLLKSTNVPIYWQRLLVDVQHWGHADRFVQRQWARAFWSEREKESEVEPQHVISSEERS